MTLGRMRSKALCIGFSVFIAGCGSANMLSQSDEFPDDVSRRESARSMLGSTNVSDAAGFEPSFESQAAAAVVGARAFIAYRAGDPRFVDYLQTPSGEDLRTCAGASELSYSVGSPTSKAFQRVRLDPPNGISALVGPVAAAAFSNAVFLSALASPEDRFHAAANDGNCVRTSQESNSKFPRSLADAGALAGACITNLPGYGVSCVRHGDDRFEGGSLAATDHFVYAAYRNASRNGVVVYRAASDGDFEEVPVPAGTQADYDVALAASGAQLFLAYVKGTEIWFRVFDESNGAWQAPRRVAEDANRRGVPARGRRPPLSVRSFTFAVLPGEPLTTLAFFWHRRVGSTSNTTLRGAVCDVLPGGSCAEPSKHLQPSNFSNNFLPTISSVAVRGADDGKTYRHVLSFWSDRRFRDGSVRLRVAEFDGGRFSERWANDAVQRPCPLLDAQSFGDWGTSDASFVIGQDTDHPSLYRTITDSSAGTCSSKGFRATPQHVSVVPLLGF